MTTRLIGVYEVPNNPDVSLIEVEVDRSPSRVDVGGFTQEDPGQDRSSWQVPYDERYLDESGSHEIGERWLGWTPEPGADEPAGTRLVFFFHFLDMTRPLMTPDGDTALPSRTSMPSRLGFVDYEPPD